jgi:flavin-dependent dehydrogenase
LFTSILLRQRGVPVTVLERARDIDPVDRTLIATDDLRGVLGELVEPAVTNEIHNVDLYADGKVASVKLQRPDVIVGRNRLIRNLADQATSLGVTIRHDRRVRHIGPRGSGLVVRSTNAANDDDEHHVSTVVGADGAFSKIARATGKSQPRTAPLIQAIVDISDRFEQDSVGVWFRPGETSYFYWLIPESETRAAVGMIAEPGTRSRALLDGFLEKHDLTPISYQAARIPIYDRWIPVRRRLGDGHVYLVGDAAGHVKVSTVGGLVTGFRGAVGVAGTILGDGGGELRRLKRELNRHLLIRRSLARFCEADYVRLISLLEQPEARTLGKVTRDHAGAALWRTVGREPRVALVGLRALLRRGGAP